MERSTPLHKHLSLKFGVVAVLPILIISWLTLVFLVPDMRKQIAAQHEGLARSVASQISAHLLGGERQLLALSDFLGSQKNWKFPELNQFLDAQCGGGDLFETIYIASTRDQRIRYVGLAGKSPGTEYLKREDLLGLDLSGRKFAVTLNTAGKPSWSETFLSTVSSQLAVALTVPVSGHTITGEITLRRLSELISGLTLKGDIVTIVLDRNGRIIADSQQRRWGQRLDNAALMQYKREETVSLTSKWFELGEEQMLGTMVDVNHLAWNVLVYQPSKGVRKQQINTFATLTFGLIFALLLALAVAYRQALRLSRTFTLYAEEKQKSQDDLLRAKQQAEAASHAKSEFLANMSHDLRTPLNGIVGMLQLLDQTNVSIEQREYIQTALKSSRRLTGLLSDILDLSRVEAGKMPLRQQSFSLVRTVAQVCELFQITFKQKGVKLESSIHPSVPEMVNGDSSRLQQILNNLLSNAAKFTEKGCVKLDLFPLPARQSGQSRVLFIVTDSGKGIAPEQMDLLFEPFQQVVDQRSLKLEGAGLGLAICRRLVKLMDGEIVVESEPGIGTTVSFCVTFGECASVPEKETTPKVEVKNGFAGLDILVAEDDSINATTVKLLLEKEGCRVVLVENGAEALKALTRRKFHAVLLDIQMPVMDGLETVQAIRRGHAGAENAGIPVVALTAYAMKGNKETFLDKGMDRYLSKPIDLSELQSVLHWVEERNW